MQRRVERALFNGQELVRHPLDVLRNAPAVHRPAGERFQDQEVQRALQQFVSGHIGFSSRLRLVLLHSPRMSMNVAHSPAASADGPGCGGREHQRSDEDERHEQQ